MISLKNVFCRLGSRICGCNIDFLSWRSKLKNKEVISVSSFSELRTLLTRSQILLTRARTPLTRARLESLDASSMYSIVIIFACQKRSRSIYGKIYLMVWIVKFYQNSICSTDDVTFLKVKTWIKRNFNATMKLTIKFSWVAEKCIKNMTKVRFCDCRSSSENRIRCSEYARC